ncbi:MAG: NAD-dependent succinate-semialdehyde dehydrogenase [Candidatus Micrarchaeia archaeon]
MAVLSINPATEEVMARFEYISDKSAIDETRRSRAASAAWRASGVFERCALLQKAARVLRRNSRRYGEMISLEMGKPIRQSVSEVEKCATACEYYAESAPRFLADEIVRTEAVKSFVAFQPLGTILGIMPWNFPFWQVFRFASATLAAGNTVVVKHSSNVPQCGMMVEEVFREAGFPESVYKNLMIGSDAVRLLVEKDLVDGISLTGSTEAGARIGELGGRHLKKTVLELGGNDPFIIMKDADAAKAAETAVSARFQNAGQSCIAAKRFIVHRDSAEAFKAAFVAGAQDLVMGDPLDERTGLGPLARADLRENIERQLDLALKEKGKILCGGRRRAGKGFFFEPTVIEAGKGSATVAKEETFGPLASIIIGEDDEDLLRIADSSGYGLSSSIWTADAEKGEAFARRIDAGMVSVNGMARSDPRLPFGGVKKSGIGRELGRHGILEFVNMKSVVIN